jgi:hypothetical protein
MIFGEESSVNKGDCLHVKDNLIIRMRDVNCDVIDGIIEGKWVPVTTHGTCSAFGCRRRPPDMDGSWEYIE